MLNFIYVSAIKFSEKETEMFVQLTNAGAALLNANTGPITLTTANWGSGVNYIPQPIDTNIHGTVVFTTVPTAPIAANGNVVKYSVYADYNAASFAFGEIGLFTANGTLFALGAATELIQKIQMTSLTVGNSIRLDIYLSMVNQNYEMWLDIAESNNEFRAAVLGSPDQLPPPQNATPNLYIISGYNSLQSSFFAYTNRQGLWNFDAYAYADQATATITGFDYQSVTIALSQYVAGMTPAYLGAVILEFTSGQNYGICRYVSSAVISGSNVTLGFDSPLAQTPIVGDTFVIFGRQALSTTIPNLPIATTTTLGAVIVGTTLTVDSTGLINVAPTAFPVTSVNSMHGDVVINAANLPGLAAVGISGSYNDLTNKPAPYTLPIASTTVLGGVKAPGDGNLTVAGDGTIDLGFTPVKSVNGNTPNASGNVTVTFSTIGLVGPTQIVNGTDFNTIQTTGLYFTMDADALSFVNVPNTQAGGTLDVEPFTTTASGGDVIQRYTQSNAIYVRRYKQSTNLWSSWVQMATTGAAIVATTTSLGVVQIGAGLSITTGGVLSTVIQSVNGYSSAAIALTAADVAAIPTSAKNALGGVPGLNNTTSGSLPTDPYTYGRMNFYENTLGTWWNAGNWNASTNHVDQTGVTGSYDVNTSLLNSGQQIIDIGFGGLNPRTTTPNYQTVNAEGQVYLVTVAGTTSIDGISTWNVGDLAVVVQGQWHRIAGGASAGAFIGFQALQTTGFTLTSSNANWAFQWFGTTGSGTLPAAASVALGASILVYNQGTGTLTMNAAAGDTLNVNSVASITIAPNTFAWFVSRQAHEWDAFGTYAGVATSAQLAAAKYYDVVGGAAASITTSQLLVQHVAARTLNFVANFAGSQGYAGTAPTASATLTVAVNGTTVGTIVFAASSQTATFTTSSGAFTVTPGQVLTVTAPLTADATLANVSFTLLGLAT
jgi:hypothetical protein